MVITCEVFLCFVAIVRVKVYYVDLFVFFVLCHWWVLLVLTPRMSLAFTVCAKRYSSICSVKIAWYMLKHAWPWWCDKREIKKTGKQHHAGRAGSWDWPATDPPGLNNFYPATRKSFHACTFFEMGQTLILCYGRKIYECVPLGWSVLGSMIQNHSDHCASKAPMNAP